MPRVPERPPSPVVCAWDKPEQPLAPGVWCGTSLCLPPQVAPVSVAPASVYGNFNLALHVGDEPAAVQWNRQRLQAQLGTGPLQWLDQVHGCDVFEATAKTTNKITVGSADAGPVADAVWTQVAGLPIAVLTADCLPVVLAARDGSCVGVAHGGWRGLVAGVLPALVSAMPVSAEELIAWGGPGIGQEAYEVGVDVARAVQALGWAEAALAPGARPAKYHLDLHCLAELSLAGVGVSRYLASSRCAFDDPGCYSYRRQGGGATGRMATIALLSD